MTAAIPIHVALVDRTGQIDVAQLARVAGALNAQVATDFGPAWHSHASVGAYPETALGPNTWAIYVQTALDEPGALGYHTDDHNQPYALVEYTRDWTVTASHELLEMLADPWGSRLHQAKHLDGREHDGHVHYLLEVCDPPEATSYEIQGVPVSDFILPAYYRSTRSGLTPKLSFAGTITEPREVAPGGYISFVDGHGEWHQRFVGRDGRVHDRDLGTFSKAAHGSLRAFTDHHARLFRAEREVEPEVEADSA